MAESLDSPKSSPDANVLLLVFFRDSVDRQTSVRCVRGRDGRSLASTDEATADGVKTTAGRWADVFRRSRERRRCAGRIARAAVEVNPPRAPAVEARRYAL